MKLLIKKLNENAVIPQRQTPYSAGYDLCACIEDGKSVTIKAGTTEKIHTGLSAELDGAKDVVLLIYARSSLAAKFGIAPANCVGVVGDRIAQLVISPIFTPEVEEVTELSDTVRGEGGFGSTGK